MPLAVTHVILSIVAADLYRDHVKNAKKYMTLWTVLIAGIAGLVPDMDIPLYHILSALGLDVPLLSHGGIMHTPIFGIVFLIPAAISWLMNKRKLSVIFLVIVFGIMFHLLLDWMIGGGDIDGIMALFPLSQEQFRGPFLGVSEDVPIREGLDAVILLAWLFHEYKRHKIKDFI